ncbi:hypothetical protein [Bosea sp. MMO-172]|uniref:hypothetical protein n=1 Tax=Bosea sp. MMO-172 TaxID=3127885 RepID=UPI003018E559
MSGRLGTQYLLLFAALGFGLAGPLVGLVCILMAFGLFDTFFQQGPTGTVLRASPDFGRFYAMSHQLLSPIAIQMAYVLGTAPAVSTGVLAGMLHRRAPSCTGFLLICSLGGAALSGIGSLAITGDTQIALIAAFAGASAALVLCGAFWKLAQPRALPVLEQELS